MKASNVGIIAIDVHFPKNYISQSDLEQRDIEILGEDKRTAITGKYTKGLGQTALAMCTDREDTVSIAMNAVTQLFAKYDLKPEMFGRLEVGTESGLDRSKSIKSYLMQLFPDNHTMLGVDNTNACYGGTAALLNSLAWVESSQWDGRLALVVCSDVAVYDTMSARPTGGCGAVAMAIGPNAPIVFQPHFAHYFVHGYDFYKPNPTNPHPIVDGPLSLTLYYQCLDECFLKFRKEGNLSVDDFDYICLHTPFMNHIKKCTGRLQFLKDLKDDDPIITSSREDNKKNSELSAAARPLFTEKVEPSCTLSKMTGNGYTASLYLAIASLIDAVELTGKRVLCFSYGSGAASTMFEFKVVGDTTKMRQALNLTARLEARTQRTPLEYEDAVARCDKRYREAPYQPTDDVSSLWEHSWYLDSIDDKWRRIYKQLP